MGIMDNEGHDPLGFGNVRRALPMQADPDPHAALKDARAEIARLRAGLFSAADQLDTIAFDMPPPNSYTPQFAMLANSIRQFVHEQSPGGKDAP